MPTKNNLSGYLHTHLCAHPPTTLTAPNPHDSIRTREYQAHNAFQLHLPHSCTGVCHHQTVKGPKGENTDCESVGKPGQKKRGDLSKLGFQDKAQTSENCISQLQNTKPYMHAHAMQKGKAGGGTGKRENSWHLSTLPLPPHQQMFTS